MGRMHTDISPAERDVEKKERRRVLWLPVLFVLALITSSMAGYILGKNTVPPPVGQIIDTILLDPENHDTDQSSTVLHLTGRVVYSDGSPAANCILELHSDPVKTITNSNGVFLFDNVPLGSHSLYVMNEDGSIASRRDVSLNRKAKKDTVSIALNDTGEYVVELSLDVRMLEISIELDTENLYINPSVVTYACTDGTVVTPHGQASVTEGPVVTPLGNVCLPDGTILMPGGEDTSAAVILPDDTVKWLQSGLTVGNDIRIAVDGTVELPDGSTITPDGTVVLPDGTEHQPGEGGILVIDGEAIPIGGNTAGDSVPHPGINDTTINPMDTESANSSAQMETSVQEAESSEDSTEGPSASSQEEERTPANSGDSMGSGSGKRETTAASTAEDETSKTPEPSTADPDRGGLEVAGHGQGTSEYISWTQSGVIDLFYDPASGGNMEIAPGSTGYYQFRLKNSRMEHLSIVLNLNEGEAHHLPLKFTLSQVTEDRGQSRQAVTGSLAGNKKKLTLATEISGGSEAVYRLDWVWPVNGNDEEDTMAGLKGGTYTLTLTIYAEGGR